MIKFSVIIPVYNAEKHLKACLSSLSNQTYPHVEIILVDDGSNDSSAAIIDEWSKFDSRVIVIHKQNEGVVSARQAGIEMATGEYVCCIDSDDFVASNYIESFARVVERDFPDIVCCGRIEYAENGGSPKEIPYPVGYYTRTDIQQYIFPSLIQKQDASYFPPSLWAKVFKRTLLVEHHSKLDYSIKIGEDGACVIPCVYSAKSMYIMGDCLYYYRQNDSSITKNKNSFDWMGPKLIALHIMKQVDLSMYDFQDQLYRKTVHELFSVIMSQFNQNKKYSMIVKEIRDKIKEPLYKEAIQKCKFKKCFRAKLMVWSMRTQVFVFCKIYLKLKRKM